MSTERECLQALDQHEEELARHKNVVGLGIVTNDENPKSKDLAVAVYVAKKEPPENLRPGELVPKSLELKTRRGSVSVPIRVIEQGLVSLE